MSTAVLVSCTKHTSFLLPPEIYSFDVLDFDLDTGNLDSTWCMWEPGLLAIKRLVGVAPVKNTWDDISCLAPSGGDITRNLYPGCQWPHEKEMDPQKCLYNKYDDVCLHFNSAVVQEFCNNKLHLSAQVSPRFKCLDKYLNVIGENG